MPGLPIAHQDAATALAADMAALQLEPTSPQAPPESFLCPITQELMEVPVFSHDGHTFEKSAILKWMETSATRSVPTTNAQVPVGWHWPINYALRDAIAEHRKRHAAKQLAVRPCTKLVSSSASCSPSAPPLTLDAWTAMATPSSSFVQPPAPPAAEIAPPQWDNNASYEAYVARIHHRHPPRYQIPPGINFDIGFYTGTTVNGRPKGCGHVTFVKGDFFDGTIDAALGKAFGCYEWADGRVYNGPLEAGHVGQVYLGSDNVYFHEHEDSHLPYFAELQPHGQGRLTYTDNTYYEGSFSGGRREGVGKLVSPTVEIVGRWSGDALCSCDDYWDHRQKARYVGRFSAKLTGDGRLETAQYVFTGMLNDGQATAEGDKQFHDGAHYHGAFRNGRENGLGKFHWPNGVYYVGEFKDGFPYGRGSYFDQRGRKVTPIFDKNAIHIQQN